MVSIESKRRLIEPGHPELSIRRQCELVDLCRASYYYQPAGETPFNLELMRRIDEIYTERPSFGVPMMTHYLRRQGYPINRKRIARLMALMGLQAVCPRRRSTSKPAPEHRIYPYLLRGVAIERVNQVWSSDITYVPLPQGFMYLTAIIDWHSRYILSWEVSNTLDGAFCLEALQRALSQAKPEIFNTDQGAQFTAHAFTGRLEQAKIRISMDGRGRVFDNIFIERFWRTIKYEDIYLREYQSVPELIVGLADFFHRYNTDRPHQSLDYRTPAEVYYATD